MSHTFKTLKFSIEDRIAYISLSRPEAANGMNLQMCEDLRDAAKVCEWDKDVKAVLITGDGRFFSAGGDLKEMLAHGDAVGQAVKKQADAIHLAISTFSRMPAPVVVAVNGVAAGAGFSFAIFGDYVLASENAKFTAAYTRAGLSPDGSCSYFLPRLVGLRRARDLLLTNRMLTGQEALEWGLISQLCSSETLMDEAKKVAQNLAAGSLGAHHMVKELLLASFDNSLETQMEIEGRYISQSVSSVDGREGIKAFSEKRAPKFL